MQVITEKLVAAFKAQLEKSKYIDVSNGVEKVMLVSRKRLNTALNCMIKEGYSVITFKGKSPEKPFFRILCREKDDPLKDILKHRKIIAGKDMEA